VAVFRQDFGFVSWCGGCSTVFSFLVVTASVGGEVFRHGFRRLLVGHVFGPWSVVVVADLSFQNQNKWLRCVVVWVSSVLRELFGGLYGYRCGWFQVTVAVVVGVEMEWWLEVLRWWCDGEVMMAVLGWSPLTAMQSNCKCRLFAYTRSFWWSPPS
jgi:hypothetical protein